MATWIPFTWNIHLPSNSLKHYNGPDVETQGVGCRRFVFSSEERSERLVPAFNPFLFFLPSLPLIFLKTLCEGEFFLFPPSNWCYSCWWQEWFHYTLPAEVRDETHRISIEYTDWFFFLLFLHSFSSCTTLVVSRKTFLPPDSSLIHDTHTHTLHLALSLLLTSSCDGRLIPDGSHVGFACVQRDLNIVC